MATSSDISTAAVASLIQLIAEKAPSTTLGEVLADPIFGGRARGVTLGQLLGTASSKSAAAPAARAGKGASKAKAGKAKVGKAKAGKASEPAAAPAKGGRAPKSADVRTEEGRTHYDAAVLGVITGGPGPWSAANVRAKTGGTDTQFRASVERLLAKKKVKRTGKARGTRYTAA